MAEDLFKDLGEGCVMLADRTYDGNAMCVTLAARGARACIKPMSSRKPILPKRWVSDPVKLAATHVPENVAFATKPASALAGKPMVAGKAEEIANALAPDVWLRLSVREGTKGAQLHDCALL